MKLSALNIVPLREGQDFRGAVDDMVLLAKAIESYGYERYWIAEHHNNSALGASATQLLIQRTLDNTNKIRVGSGGVMLPNHSPYIIAEQYGTLDALYPNRVDLGLGRAPGTDAQTAKAIRRKEPWDIDFERDFSELESYFEDSGEVKAFPAAGRNVPYFILGSSLDSAYFSAKKGLPYAFAAHFAPAQLKKANNIYYNNFTPSKYLKNPYFILAMNVFISDTDEQAKRLSTSHMQACLSIITGENKSLKPPKNSEDEVWEDYIKAEKVPNFGPVVLQFSNIVSHEKQIVKQMMSGSIIGSTDTASSELKRIKQTMNFDELMAHSFIFDINDQITSYRLLSEIAKDL